MKARAVCVPMGRPLVAGSLLWVAMLIFSLAAMLLTSCTGAEPEITPSTTAQGATATQPHDFAYSYQSDTVANTQSAGIRPATRIKSLNQLQTLANAATQNFAITNKKDTVVIGNKGVKVLFPANCFVLPYPGAKVNVELKEYNSTADFFFAGLSTQSNGQLLESGGTIYISASCDGREVKLQNGKQVKLAFPTGRTVPGMQTFLGDEQSNGTVNWIPTNNTATNTFASYNLYAQKKVKGIKKKQALSKLTTPRYQVQALGSWGYCTRFSDTTKYKNVLEYFDKNFSISKEDAALLKGTYIGFNYIIGARKAMWVKAKFYHWPSTAGYTKYGLKGAIKRVKSAFLKTLKAMEKVENTKTSFGCGGARLTEEIRLYINDLDMSTVDAKITLGGTIEQEYEYDAWEYDQYKADSIAQNDARFYILNTGVLGWINCDRFYDNTAPRNNIVVKVDADSDTEVRVIFKDIMSLMDAVYSADSGEHTVYSVPNNCNVKYIAMQNRPDGMYYAVKDATTAQTNVTGFEFKPMTVDAIKGELASL